MKVLGESIHSHIAQDRDNGDCECVPHVARLDARDDMRDASLPCLPQLDGGCYVRQALPNR
jgi:hypothetical protein